METVTIKLRIGSAPRMIRYEYDITKGSKFTDFRNLIDEVIDVTTPGKDLEVAWKGKKLYFCQTKWKFSSDQDGDLVPIQTDSELCCALAERVKTDTYFRLFCVTGSVSFFVMMLKN